MLRAALLNSTFSRASTHISLLSIVEGAFAPGIRPIHEDAQAVQYREEKEENTVIQKDDHHHQESFKDDFTSGHARLKNAFPNSFFDSLIIFSGRVLDSPNYLVDDDGYVYVVQFRVDVQKNKFSLPIRVTARKRSVIHYIMNNLEKGEKILVKGTFHGFGDGLRVAVQPMNIDILPDDGTPV